MQNNDLIGKVVLSLAGRDKNQEYILVGIDNDKVLLANGNTKSVLKPKIKNIKHINILDHIDEEIRSAIRSKKKDTDLKIKRFLKLRGIVKEG